MVEHGVSGLLARSLDEWHGALESLANDLALRKKMGESGIQRVKRSFSTGAIFARMNSCLEGLSGKRAG